MTKIQNKLIPTVNYSKNDVLAYLSKSEQKTKQNQKKIKQKESNQPKCNKNPNKQINNNRKTIAL